MKRKIKPKVRETGRILADPRKQTANNSYSTTLFYEDQRFTCRDCGTKCVWTAKQQQLWYEQWGGPIQSRAVRCRPCREKVRRAKIEQKRHMYEMGQKKRQR